MNLTPWAADKCIMKEDVFKIEIHNILSAQFLYQFIDEYQEEIMKDINAKGPSQDDLSLLEFKMFDANSVTMHSGYLDFVFGIPLTEE